MSKCTQKANDNPIHRVIIKELQKKYGVTTHFIGMSLRGDRQSATSTKICEDYKRMKHEIQNMLKDV